ncbi:hypothetical protein EJB05_44273 [Eragrostis curvula]|uniref:Uncharacterized protein n=1 Tax=Eragrostis curvula TaxID=38414 RepID=A0A5J9THM1_9POAL|nr:hypothetical protein EJB05_44273 [Eragrostis curvula]
MERDCLRRHRRRRTAAASPPSCGRSSSPPLAVWQPRPPGRGWSTMACDDGLRRHASPPSCTYPQLLLLFGDQGRLLLPLLGMAPLSSCCTTTRIGSTSTVLVDHYEDKIRRFLLPNIALGRRINKVARRAGKHSNHPQGATILQWSTGADTRHRPNITTGVGIEKLRHQVTDSPFSMLGKSQYALFAKIMDPTGISVTSFLFNCMKLTEDTIMDVVIFGGRHVD